MNGYEKIVNIIKSQSNSSTGIFLTTMESSDSCYVNRLKLERDDLFIAKHLVTSLEKGDTVVVMRLNETKYVILERVV